MPSVSSSRDASKKTIPWPVRSADFAAENLPDGDVYELDRRPAFAWSLLRLARFLLARKGALPRLLGAAGPCLADGLLQRLRISPRRLFTPPQRLLLAAAQDLPPNGLRLLLAEWLEFRRRVKETPWVLVVRATSGSSASSRAETILPFWEQVQALKRQLRIRNARVLFSAGLLHGREFDRWLGNVDGCVFASLGDGASQTALRALAFSKPIIAPGHTGFADYLPAKYPYRFVTYPTTLRFVGGPQGRDYYDPSSTWHMPAPFALADALVRFAEDPPECRTEAAERAGAIVKRRCDQQRVAAMLAEEVRQLEAGQYQRAEEEEWGRDIVMRPPRAPEPQRVRYESVPT